MFSNYVLAYPSETLYDHEFTCIISPQVRNFYSDPTIMIKHKLPYNYFIFLLSRYPREVIVDSTPVLIINNEKKIIGYSILLNDDIVSFIDNIIRIRKLFSNKITSSKYLSFIMTRESEMNLPNYHVSQVLNTILCFKSKVINGTIDIKCNLDEYLNTIENNNDYFYQYDGYHGSLI